MGCNLYDMFIYGGKRHSIGYIYIGFNSTFKWAVFNFPPPPTPDIAKLMSTHLYRPDIVHFYAQTGRRILFYRKFSMSLFGITS